MHDGEKLYFEWVRESRGSYFVEYLPPRIGNSFATLNVVFPDKFDASQVAGIMISELRHWLSRYPVALMVIAFDVRENVVRTDNMDHHSCLVGWMTANSREVVWSWLLDDLTKFLETAPPHPDWRTIYTDIPCRTDAEVKADTSEEAEKTRRQNLTLRMVLTLWFAVIPTSWAIYQFLGPAWLGGIILAYTLWKIWHAWLKLMGRAKPSISEAEAAEKKRLTDHYYYHCKRNPGGFSKLMVENLTSDIAERTRKQAEDLASKKL